MSYEFLTLATADGVARVTLNRPAVHNAFNAALIEELRACFAALGTAPDVRAVVLAGAGPSF
jgi:methylglutaconyl-CoA hydratase